MDSGKLFKIARSIALLLNRDELSHLFQPLSTNLKAIGPFPIQSAAVPRVVTVKARITTKNPEETNKIQTETNFCFLT